MKSLSVRLSPSSIVITLPIGILPVVLSAAPFNCGDYNEPVYVVSDPRVFAEAIVDALNREEEDGSTLVHRLFDEAMDAAIEDGCEGVGAAAPKESAR